MGGKNEYPRPPHNQLQNNYLCSQDEWFLTEGLNADLFNNKTKYPYSVFLVLGGRRPYRFVGKYRIPPRRYLGRKIRIKNRRYTKRNCQRAARQGRYRVFVIFRGRLCFVSRSSPRKLMIYGRSRSKRPEKSIKVYVKPKG